MDIHRMRGNAICILAQALAAIGATDISDLTGGNLRNAIPREAHARIGLAHEAAAGAQEALVNLAAQIRAGLPAEDQGLALSLMPTDDEVRAVIEDAQHVLDVLRAMPHGVDRMSPVIAGLVETSNNLAAISCADGALKISCLLRSSSAFQKADLAERIACIVRLAGGLAHYDGDYGGWQPQPASRLVQLFQRTGEALFGHVPPLKVIHAGLECGILSENYPHWEMISFGPSITGAHSPDEAVRIDTVARCYQWLQVALRELAQP